MLLFKIDDIVLILNLLKMILKDVKWTFFVNVLIIKCDCGAEFEWPTNYSLVECPKCKNKEVWHEDALNFEELKNFKLIKNFL